MLNYLRILFAYLRYEFAARSKNTVVFSGYDSLKYNFNSKYLFEYFLANAPQYKVYFIINNDVLRAELNKTSDLISSQPRGFRILRLFSPLSPGSPRAVCRFGSRMSIFDGS